MANLFLRSALAFVTCAALLPVAEAGAQASSGPDAEGSSKAWRKVLRKSQRGTARFQNLLKSGAGKEGEIRIDLNRQGSGSATVMLGGSVVFRGTVSLNELGELIAFAPAGGAMLSGSAVGTPEGDLALDVNVTVQGERTAVRTPRAAVVPGPGVAGAYTLIFSADSGVALQVGVTGFGTLRVAPTGAYSFSARLSDGSGFGRTGQLSTRTRLQLAALAPTGHSLSGTMDFGDTGIADVSGQNLVWRQPTSGPLGGSGQTGFVDVRGSTYRKKAGFEDIPQWSFSSVNREDNDDASASLAPSPEDKKVLLSGPPQNIKVKLDKETGLLRGSFLKSPNLVTRYKLSGVVYQKTDEGAGLTKPETGGFIYKGNFQMLGL